MHSFRILYFSVSEIILNSLTGDQAKCFYRLFVSISPLVKIFSAIEGR